MWICDPSTNHTATGYSERLDAYLQGTNTHSTGLIAWLNEQGCAGCKALSVKMVDHAATRVIAEKIIELAQRGVRDVSSMTVMTLKEFKSGD